MEFKKLISINEFESLKKGDIVIVHYDEKQPYWNREMQGTKSYTIHSIKSRQKEIILQIKNNHYFNYEMYLKGNSVVKEAWTVDTQSEPLGNNSHQGHKEISSFRAKCSSSPDKMATNDLGAANHDKAKAVVINYGVDYPTQQEVEKALEDSHDKAKEDEDGR